MERTPEFKERKEVFKPEIRLEFLRHDRREPATEEKPDEKSRLTAEGRKHATEMGKTKSPSPETGFAYGSPRERTQEAAMRQLLANEGWVSDETTLEEISDEIKKRLPYGKKLSVSEKLNYKTDANPKFAEVYNQHYSKTKDTVPFLYYDSDRLVKELGDADDYSYTRLAANAAEFVKKYITILPRWREILEKNPQKYAGGSEMQRFLGTHSTIGESFLLKIIERTEGAEAARQFIEDLPDKNGVDFSDGISIVLGFEGEKPKVKVSFHDKTWEVDESMIDGIIEDRTRLDEEIKKNLQEEK